MAIVCTRHVWVQASGQMVCRLCLTPKNLSKSDSAFGKDTNPKAISRTQPALPDGMTKMPAETVQNEKPKTAGRKPGQPTRPADVVALENLEDACSRLLWYLTENPASALGVRLARCAKAGVDRARAEKGLQMIESAVQIARTQFVAAYETPVREKGVAAQRPNVSL